MATLEQLANEHGIKLEKPKTKAEMHAAIKAKCKTKCPQCGKFTEILVQWTDVHCPGVYCNACGWHEALPDPLPLLSKIENVLPPSLLELVKACPGNATVRSLINQQALLPVPAICKTWAEIEQWFDYSVEKAQSVGVPAGALGLQLHLIINDVETGRCNYSYARRCSDIFNVTPEILSNAIHNIVEQGLSWGSVLDYVKGAFEHRIEDGDIQPHMRRYEGPTCEEYETEETGNELRVSFYENNNALDVIQRWASQHMPAEYETISNQ